MVEPDYKELYLLTQKENHRLAQLLEEAIAGNKELQAQMKALEARLDKLLHQLEKKNKKEYGSKNERHNPRPANSSERKQKGNGEVLLPPLPPPADEDSEKNPSLEELVTSGVLIAQPVDHNVDPSAAICPDCQVETCFLGTQVSRQLERIVGALRVLEHQQEVRSCNRCKQYVVTAEKPMAPIPGSYAAPGLLSFVIVSKFLDGLPLYRIRKILQREGSLIPRSTLSDWVLSAAFTLEPLYDTLKRDLLKSKIIKTDDSPVKVQDRKLKGKMRKAKQTTYIGDKHHPVILFEYSPNQSFKKNNAFLKDFVGLVQADAHGGFDALFHEGSNKIELGCHVHARRKYFECPDCSIQAVQDILDIYTDLYQIEDRIAKLPNAEKLAWRRRCSKPLIKRFYSILLDVQKTFPPKDPIRDAADYTLKNWLALTRFLKDADIDLDNNASERAIKDFVLMRKNALFVGSDEGGKAAAIHLSLVASAKRIGIDPVAYLTDVLSRINSMKTNELEQLLPSRWAELQAARASEIPVIAPEVVSDNSTAFIQPP
jgi:transposase